MPTDYESEGDGARWSPLDSDEWYAARDAVAGLRDVLIAAGMERDFPYLRADLNAFGHGLIELGRISPETAHRLTELLRLALESTYDAPGTGTNGRQQRND
ncbi:hypothetical protein OIE63_12780 [Streptomyces sp. NBC_01795]|uniref:hypothetical protein n=1 Tax=Streptomyces sp. NBC_01795 TaxID=2975943 RepID=UPI002DDB0E41|nr:hypothetical protein [Streptomyces sp. NBC_01795]WSA92348.1 hypothetical protein OIE63_12780 [Streptomyces sp. NBC_01795]